MICAASAPVLRARDIDDPVRGSERLSGLDEGVPILAARWCKKLGAGWTAVLLSCAADIETIEATHHGACGVWPAQGNSLALT